MIISLFKNCAWLQQFHVLIDSFKWYMFTLIFWKKSACKWAYIINFKQLIFLNLITVIQLVYKSPVKKDLMRIIFLKSNECLKSHFILSILHVLLIFIIPETIHSFHNKCKANLHIALHIVLWTLLKSTEVIRHIKDIY